MTTSIPTPAEYDLAREQAHRAAVRLADVWIGSHDPAEVKTELGRDFDQITRTEWEYVWAVEAFRAQWLPFEETHRIFPDGALMPPAGGAPFADTAEWERYEAASRAVLRAGETMLDTLRGDQS